MGRENVEEVHVASLIEDRIIAIRGRKPLARSSSRNILFPIVVEEVGRVQSCPFGQDVCALEDELVVVINLQDRAEIFRLQSQVPFHLVDAGGARTEATGRVNAVKNE